MQIRRDGGTETVYLSTRRSGDVGLKMQHLKRDYRTAQRRTAHAFQEVALVASKANALAATGKPCEAELERLALQQDQAGAVAQDSANGALEHATDLARLALRECHGEDAERILDCLTDRQIHQCVGIIETGDVPADFFPLSATPPSASGTPPPGDAATAPSSPTASPAATSRPAA